MEKRILQLVENHPAMQAIQRGAIPDDALLLDLERTLSRELAHSDLELTPDMLKKVFAHTTDNFLALVRQVLEIDSLPDYRELVDAPIRALHRRTPLQRRPDCFLRRAERVFTEAPHRTG